MSVGSPTQVSYYSSSTQVLQAKQELEASFDIPKILKPIEAVYQDALKMVVYHSNQTKQQLRSEAIPLSVTLQLIDLLGMDQIQYEDQLKYTIAKACRIFMDLTFILSLASKRNIYPDTHKKICDDLKKVIETLPQKEVRTNYELNCCLATALVLNSEKMYLKTFAADNLVEIFKAIVSLSPGDLTDTLVKLGQDLYDQIKTLWFVHVFPLHYKSQALLAQINFSQKDISVLTNYYQGHQDHLKHYPTTPKVAFCALEFLGAFMQKAIENNHAQLQIQALKGGDNTEQAPGIATFTQLGLEHATLDPLKAKNFWKVRYQAVQLIFHISMNENVDKKVWQRGLRCISENFKRKENSTFSQMITQSLSEMSKLLSQKQSFKERVEYFNKQVVTKDKDKLGAEVKTAREKLIQQLQEKEEKGKVKKKAQEQAASGVAVDDAQLQLSEAAVTLDIAKLEAEIVQTQEELEYLQMEEALADFQLIKG
jgi:hypothetical protein